jgi:3',5'-cyclic AMP phosphodiesterase CpdA
MRFSRLTAFFLLLGCLAGLPASARAEAEPVTVLAAGDIAFCERSLLRQLKDRHHGHSAEPGAPATAALLDRLSGAILVLGDLAYWRGTEAEFEGCYDLSWGRHKARSRPVPGNHEYRSPEAAPYYAYWGGRAGQPDKGYYSFDLGAWHLVALNSNLEGEAMAEQQAWLRRDLAASKARCILAYAHHPPFSSGKNRDQLHMAGLYRLLYEAGTSLFLAGHDHNYERFAPMDSEGRLDPKRGTRSFVVGTGGGQLKAYAISDPPRANSEVVDGSTWGVLEFTLHEDRYDWAFVPVEGATFEDSGSAECVERPVAN